MKMRNQFLELVHIYSVSDYDNGLSYDSHKKKWVKNIDYSGEYISSGFTCYSYKAAKRHLKKHSEIPCGEGFVLVSKYIGFDRKLIKK